jgi:hypothetical protein
VLRYGLRELLLVQPGTSAYRPPPDPGAPHIQAALARAARDRRDGRATSSAWSDEERPAWLDTPPRDALEAGLVYQAARHPKTLCAPAPWPQEVGLLAAELLLASTVPRIRPLRRESLLWAATLAGGTLTVAGLRWVAQHRQARRIGLEPQTAPRPAAPGVALVIAALYLADVVWRRRRRPGRYPWMLEGAASAIRTLDGRRAWERAYRVRETSVPSVQSSASP